MAFLQPDDDFSRERALFSTIEADSGLNEGDILRAIRRLDDDIRREEEREAGLNLSEAVNPNINPETGARLARMAGVPIETGDQFKAAKPILKRMSGVLTDPKLSADVKDMSLQNDMEEIEQILLRSTTQGGRRGVAVTGRTRAGRRATELRGFESEPFIEEGKITGRFFPEPEKPEFDVEQFLRTLEPETTLLGGEAGRRELEQIRRRNALRIAEFQAGRPKPVAISPGQKLFEVSPGEARPLAEAPLPPAPVKRPTTIEAALLEPGLPPERKRELVELKQAISGKGLSGRLTMPDGTVLEIGRGDTISDLTPGARTQIQKEIREAQGRLQEFNNLATNPQFSPEKNLTFYRTGLAQLGSFLDEVDPRISEFFNLKDNIKDFAAFKALTENLFTAWRRSVTGVAFRPEEEKALRKAFPSTEDGPTEFKAKLDAVRELNRRIIERLQNFRPGEKIDVLGELNKIRAESEAPAKIDLRQFLK